MSKQQALVRIVAKSPDGTIDQIYFSDSYTTDSPFSPTTSGPSWTSPRVEDLNCNTFNSPVINEIAEYTIFTPSRLLKAALNTEESNSRDLLASFVHNFLPSRIHPRSHIRFLDFSYVHEMALSHPTLLNACLACSLSAIGARFRVLESQSRADRCYARCIRLLRDAIQGGECEGSEDWLLATVVILCLYENRQPGYNPAAAAAHIAAAGQVFRERARAKMNAVSSASDWLLGTQTWPTLIFERVFIEAFLYHCMVMSVQETSLTPLQDVLLRPIFDDYFELCVVPTTPDAENWPVFGMHYQIIRLLSDLLAAIDHSEAAPATHEARDIHEVMTQLEIWELDTITNAYGPHIMLYISAAKLLGYHHLSITPSNYQNYSAIFQEQLKQLVQDELEQCLAYLSTIQIINSTFTRYFYWPLAIIDTVVRDTRASHLIEQKLQDVPLIDPAGKKAYEWVSKGFERRFKTRSDDIKNGTVAISQISSTYT
jgi:hypothetical protein